MKDKYNRKLLCILLLLCLTSCSTVRFEHEMEVGNGNMMDYMATEVYIHVALVQPF